MAVFHGYRSCPGNGVDALSYNDSLDTQLVNSSSNAYEGA